MRFSVLSYNVLHSHGAKRLLKNRSSGSWAVDRLRRVAERVQREAPDVACLQEVDTSAHAELSRALGEDYECAVHARNESLPPQDGCTVFVRKEKFDVLRMQHFRLRDSSAQHLPVLNHASAPTGHGASGMAAALWRELHEKLNLAIALHLRPRAVHGSSDPACTQELCVATTHLFWDPRYPDLKLLQAFLLARELDTFAAELPVVLAGDLNSTPYLDSGEASGVYALLTEGCVLPSHPHHPAALRRGVGILRGVSATHVPELTVSPFKSAYQEALGEDGPVTNASTDFAGCLDYILYRDGKHAGTSGSHALRLNGVQSLPSKEALRAHMPLPSEEYPSDHLPLVAEFELRQGITVP